MKKIGVIYRYYPGWIGGTIYVYNLLRALEKREGFNSRYKLTLFVSRCEIEKLDLNLKNLNFEIVFYDDTKIVKFFKKVLYRLFKIRAARTYQYKLDMLFPVFTDWEYFCKTPLENKFFWIPDFQCFDLPNLFTEADKKRRHNEYEWIFKFARNLVLSSKSVENHMQILYPKTYFPRTYILHFSTFNDDVLKMDWSKLEIDRPYIICPNQFWAHKNQELVLKAVDYLGVEKLPFLIVFTGKHEDPRNPKHFQDVISPYLESSYVKNNVRLLGFIDRNIQLGLIHDSFGLIQPSKFEGWSTVIEDGMYFNKRIIASNLDVNIEQLGENATYFQTDDYIGLSQMINDLYENRDKPVNYNYEKKQELFANDFIKMFDKKNDQ
jgi:glycosyltransferase involved in cell wall biosynthesis